MYRATGREQCQAPRSGLCALESEVPRGFGEEAESLHCHDPGELKAFFWELEPGRWHPAPPLPAAGQKRGAPSLPLPLQLLPRSSRHHHAILHLLRLFPRTAHACYSWQKTEKGNRGLKGQCQNQRQGKPVTWGRRQNTWPLGSSKRKTCFAETTAGSGLGAGANYYSASSPGPGIMLCNRPEGPTS